MAVNTNRFCWVISVTDEDLLSGEHDLDRVAVPLDVEGTIWLEVLKEVDACKVACRVVDMHVLRAGV
ncbi:unannotated protein [freshwater metagenome]|uniref:Unannotated protein n=1 Tax=freshwater metagenome TaxID=449393 RepID=A0A6J6X6P9_9ZZZZ